MFDETTTVQQLVKKYSTPDFNQKLDTREGIVAKELAKQTERSQKIELLLNSLRQVLSDTHQREAGQIEPLLYTKWAEERENPIPFPPLLNAWTDLRFRLTKKASTQGENRHLFSQM